MDNATAKLVMRHLHKFHHSDRFKARLESSIFVCRTQFRSFQQHASSRTLFRKYTATTPKSYRKQPADATASRQRNLDSGITVDCEGENGVLARKTNNQN